MRDVVEGKCGCGYAKWHSDRQQWYTTHQVWHSEVSSNPLCFESIAITVYLDGGYCPRCGYRLDPDGFARRMVDITVEELRERVGVLEENSKLYTFLTDAMSHVAKPKHLMA